MLLPFLGTLCLIFSCSCGHYKCVFDDMLQYLAIPMDSEVRVYENETWDLAFSLTDDSIKEVILGSLLGNRNAPSGNCDAPLGQWNASSWGLTLIFGVAISTFKINF